MEHLVLVFALLCAAGTAQAQVYEAILAAHPDAQEMRPIEQGVRAHDRPHPLTQATASLSAFDVECLYSSSNQPPQLPG